MTREELCICACKYAIGELTRKGSSAFITSAHDGRQQISWVEVVEWLKDLRELPPVTPTGWITVNERIPKPNETEHMIVKYYLVQNEYGDMMVARWDGKGWKQMYQPNSYLEDDVIAWMPLPSPYELQESEDD